MKIKLIHTIFEIHLINQDLFRNFFAAYIIDDEKTDVYIYQDTYEEEVEKGDKKIDTVYYDLFEKDGKEFQYQKSEDGSSYVGRINYNDKEMRFATKNENDYYLIILLLHYMVTRYLQDKYDCILMHGSSFTYNGRGIILTAPSGTGKSTHASLWKKYYDIVYVNDDKNYIVLEDGKPYLYGNPWSGKHNINNNIVVELKDVVFLYQNSSNSITRLSKRDAFMKLMHQIVAPQDEKSFDKWNKIIDKILDLPCYLLGCNISKAAVDLLKGEIENENI